MRRRQEPQFEVFDAALAGTCLIEASAGTGKTWTIAALYARLVLERAVPVARILVVTFTNAATAELRERVRARLASLRDAFVRGQASRDDTFAARCLACYDAAEAVALLTRALTGFDQAAVHTIHGFCQRALADHAFESGMPFRTELVPDERPLIMEVVEDYWRREVYTAPAAFARLVHESGFSPAVLAAEVAVHAGKRYLEIDAPPGQPSVAAEIEALRTTWRAAQACWRDEQAQVLAALAAHPNRHMYRGNLMPARIAALDGFFAAAEASFAFPDKAECFTASVVAAKANGRAYPAHRFFALCQELAEAARRARAGFRRRLYEYARTELPARKARRRVQSYDDLLNNLAQALTGPAGDALAATLRERYAAALIDEFQDTDPVQYEIFARIYQGSDAPVYFVGDPKQAIYSFRGADVYAYLAARRATAARATLTQNWRSTPALIAAINAVYQACARPFLAEGIPFVPAQAAEREREPLAIAHDAPAALRVWLVRDHDGGIMGKGDAQQRIVQALAGEIVRLLNAAAAGQARIGGRALTGGDIAVLVRAHWQAQLIKAELRRRGVAAVEYSQESVFASREAAEIERVLMAVAEPGRERLLRAALATEMLGYQAAQLERLRTDEGAWQALLERFAALHALWQERGFIRMFRALLAEHGVAARLLGYGDGERRLTNINHLAELLQAQSAAGQGGLEGLIQWLAERRQRGDIGEEAVLRLESDEHLVKLVTVHAAKGLEYAITFCPFLWDGRLHTSDKTPVVRFHDPERDHRAVLDLGTDALEERVRLAKREEFAENLRLAYVALTRARYRCYLAWGRIKDAETSALAWLCHGEGLERADDPVAALAQRFEQLSSADIEAGVRRVARQAPTGAIAVQPLPEPSDARFAPARAESHALQARRFRGRSAMAWRIASFTALASRTAAEAPDYDALRDAERLPPLPDDDSIHAFPRGTRAGTCLHAIFEHLDFPLASTPALEPLVERTLREHRYPDSWVPAVSGMVRAVLATPLDGQRLRLAQVTRARRIDEMEFHYPVARLEAGGLNRILAQHDAGGPAPFSFEAVRGFMKGYIDLVFEHGERYYLVDYKSNWLGGALEDYAPEALAREVAAEGYYLQYLLYTVALHRYLGTRLVDYDYERHFGGVYYLFLRGMDPARGRACGVYYDRPSAALIAALDAYLRGPGPEEGDARAA